MTNEQQAIFLYSIRTDLNNTILNCNMEDTEQGAEFSFIVVKLDEYIKVLIGKEILGVPDINCPKCGGETAKGDTINTSLASYLDTAESRWECNKEPDTIYRGPIGGCTPPSSLVGYIKNEESKLKYNETLHKSDIIHVCESCLTAHCWANVDRCQNYNSVDIIKTVAELQDLGKEDDTYWWQCRARCY